MKVIVQIPCYNEEQTLPLVMRDMPKSIPGVDVLETLVIDDGSSDRTVEVARELGVHHVVRHNGNKGLAAAFQTGLDACLRLGADIIVNTDGDNQYPQEMIPDLIAPILRGEADMVVGDRQVRQIEHFSPVKKILQVMGSWVVRQASGTPVPDAPSGFRALSKDAALRLNVITKYTYTLETIVQAGKKNIKVASVPVRTNKVTRPSRLIRGVFDYLKKSSATIVRIYALYEPLKVFFYIGLFLMLIATYGVISLLFHYFLQEEMNFRQTFERHLPTTIATLIALVFGFQIWLIGLLADLIAAGRRLTEETLYRVKRMELELSDMREGTPPPNPSPVTAIAGPPKPVSGEVSSISEEIPAGDNIWKTTIEIAEPRIDAYVIQEALNAGERQLAQLFEKFTEPARNTLQLAQKEALRRRQNRIGTEHVLLGLVSQSDGVAARVLHNLGVTPQKVRSLIHALAHENGASSVGGVSLTMRALRALELAQEEASRLGHNYIGTEHLLLGLIRENDGVAAKVLDGLGASLDKVRAQVSEVLGREA
ncbi:MAG TPA: Clp protease N-terminal domain-containing protein [Chloroflexia bacterium]|jgi:glycosyltransferase involved in cell wall biosynthesis